MRVCCIPAGTGGVAFYRIHQPYGWLKEQGHEIFIFDPMEHDSNRLLQEQMAADVIVYQCPFSTLVRDAIKTLKLGGKHGKKTKVVVEFDDDLFNVNHWNEKYSLFGTQEIKFTYCDKQSIDNLLNSKKEDWINPIKNEDGSVTFNVWKDGEAGFDIKRNFFNAMATQEVIAMADLVTVTTQELGKEYRKYRPKGAIAVMPNMIDFKRWLPMKENDTDEIRIGWQGGSAHFGDLLMIADDLIKISEKYKNVKFVFMGIQYDALMNQLGDRVEWHPWHGDIATYPLIVRDLKLDIGLCPIEDTKFNRGKSPLKWEEYSAMKIPSVVSNTVYGHEVSHGKTGMIASNKGDWFKYIEQLILDEPLRKEMAQKAYDRVNYKFNLNNAQMYWDCLTDLVGKPKLLKVG